MRTIKKKCLIGLLSVVMALFTFMPAKANEANVNEFQIENYSVEEGKIVVYGYEKGDTEITEENITVKLEDNLLSVTGIDKFDLSEDPFTYYCMVDVSGSMDKERIEQIQGMINTLIDSMKAADNMQIVTVADDIITLPYTSDQGALKEFNSEIEVTRQDTNLYAAINDAIASLSHDSVVNSRKCLIIFSDGADEQITGITKDEVNNSIKESNIPVYTVAMLPAKAKDSQIESAKILGSFARDSLGGIHFAPTLNEEEYDSVVNAIWENINEGYVIDCELKDIIVSGNTLKLQTIVKYDTGVDAVDLLEIPTEYIKDYIYITPEPEPEPVSEVIVEEEPETVVEQEETLILGLKPVVFIIIVAAVILLIIAVVVILILNKKKTTEPVPEPVNIPEPPRKVSEPLGQNPVKPVKKVPENTIKFVRLKTKGDECLEIKFGDSCRIGRDSAKSDFVIDTDKSVSGLHCTVFKKEGSFYIRDEKSSNGTFVNGIPVEGEFKLNQDDIVLIGSYEYRVVW